MSQSYTLTELTTFVRRIFALNLPDPVWVKAELAQVSNARGHRWMTLIQKSDDAPDGLIEAQLEAVCWSGQLLQLAMTYGRKTLNELLQQGMYVRLRVSFSFHERHGLRLIIEDVDPDFTIGALELQRRRTLEILEKEGLIHKNSQLPLSPVARRFAIITARTAAGWADFEEHLTHNRWRFSFTTDMYDAAMQGAAAVTEICRRIEEINQYAAHYDAIVIIRGGGSRMDLSVYDDETLCRTIASSSLPVIVGVGHENDQLLIDEVAWKALKTPTAVAEFISQRVADAEEYLLSQARQIIDLGQYRLQQQLPNLQYLDELITRATKTTIQQENNRVDRLEMGVNHLSHQAVQHAFLHLDGKSQFLEAILPDRILERGYALVIQEGRVITQAEDLKQGPAQIKFHDSTADIVKPT